MGCFSLADTDDLSATEDTTEQLCRNTSCVYYYSLRVLTTRWRCYSVDFSRPSFNGCHAGLHAMHHYTLVPTVKLLLNPNIYDSIFHALRTWSVDSRKVWFTFRKLSNNCLISEQCTFESLVPTVTTEPADASLDPAIRSVCGVCVCRCLSGTFHTVTMHKTQHWGEIISFRYSLTVCQHAFRATDWLADFVSWVFSSILVNVFSVTNVKPDVLCNSGISLRRLY